MTDYLAPANTLEVIRGASRTVYLLVEAPEGGALNLTGAFVYFTVKRRVEDAYPLLQKTSTLAEDIALVAPREGRVEIYLTPNDTKNMAPGVYVFDVWVVMADGKRHPVVPQSTFEVHPSVTLLP